MDAGLKVAGRHSAGKYKRHKMHKRHEDRNAGVDSPGLPAHNPLAGAGCDDRG